MKDALIATGLIITIVIAGGIAILLLAHIAQLIILLRHLP